MRRSGRLVGSLVCLVVVACGGGGDKARDDAAIQDDAAIDVPLNPSALTISPTLHDFGTVAISQTGTFVFTVTNTGMGPTGAMTVESAGAHAVDFTATTCGELDPSETCSITVAFVPSAQGARVATLQVAAAGGGTASVLLQGTAVAPTSLTLTPAMQAMGDVVTGQQSQPFSFTVANIGIQPSGALSLTLVGGDVSQFAVEAPATGDCTTSTQLNGGASCTIRVRFKPTTLGAKETTLQVSANPGNTVTAALSGAGVAPGAAALSVLPTSIGFGTITVGQASTPTVVTVTNTGGMPSSTVSIVSEAARFSITQNNCTTLAAGADCTFQVVYTPNVAGVDSGNVRVQAAMGGNIAVFVSGTGSATLLTSVTGPTTSSRVTSNPAGIDCAAATAGNVCTQAFTQSPVQLTAMAGSGETFAGWGGACLAAGLTTTCTLVMDAAKSVTATFAAKQTLNVNPAPTGGTITADVGTISCGAAGAACSFDYAANTAVVLTATAAPGYRFGSWSGACTGTAACNVTMNTGRTVSATFIQQYTLTIVSKDLGVGTASTVVATSSAGTSMCSSTVGNGTTCTIAYDVNTQVTPTTTLGANAAFVDWSGDPSCTGAVCQPLQMNQDRTITARFAAYSIVVTLSGSGTVGVTPTTSGATCSSSPCTLVFPGGTSVMLTPQASPGNTFAGWGGGFGMGGSGNCTGTGTCSINLALVDTNKTALAEFKTSRTLTVTKTITAGPGTGSSVTSTPVGISCGDGCSSQQATYPDGLMVTLLAVPGSGYELSAWTGACAAVMMMMPMCTVTMDAAKSVGVSFAPGPDLTVSAVACTPDPVAPGSTLSCMVTVQNIGTLSSGAFTTRLALSTDTTIDGTDPQLTTCAFTSIAAGGSSTVTCAGTVAGGTTAADYYAGAMADSTTAIAEKSEANNTGSDLVTVIRPDITVDSVACTPNPAQPAAAAMCAVMFANAGPAIGAFSYDVRYSIDTTIDTTDVLLGTCTVSGGIAANATASASCNVTLPATLGDKYIGVRADSAAAIMETNEANNTGSTPFAIGTDLVLSALSCTNEVVAGGTVTCTYTVSNEGAAVGALDLELRLSTDAVLTTADTLLASCTMPALGEGGTANGTCAGIIPAGTTGIRFVGVTVDPYDLVAEWDATNNASNELVGIRAPTASPDLVPVSLACPSSQAGGEPMTCTVVVGNVGGAAAGASSLKLRWSISTGTGYADLGSPCAVGALAASASTVVSCIVPAPGPPASGSDTRYIVAVVDSGGVVAESDETNNTSAYDSVSVSATVTSVDLIVSALVCPARSTSGGSITCSVTIANIGDTAAGPFANKIVRSADTSPVAGDTPNADCAAPTGVGAHASITLSCGLTLSGVTAGSMYIGFVADSGNAVGEASNTNNTRTTPFTVVASGVDLSVTSFACTPAGTVAGQSVVCSGVVDNAGTSTAAGSTVAIILNGSTAGSCAVPAIPSLGTAAFDCLTTIPGGTPVSTATLTATADFGGVVAESNEANNTKTTTVRVLNATPDLVPQNLSCSGDGANASCTVTVLNDSVSPVSPFAVDIRQNGTSRCTIASGALAALASMTYSCSWALSSNSSSMTAVADSGSVIVEANEGNNTAAATLALPDLRITGVSCGRNVGSAAPYCLVYTVNQGAAASVATIVRVRGSTNTTYDTTDTDLGTASVPALAAGSTDTAAVNVTTTIPTYYVARVDDGGVLQETSEANNTGSQITLANLSFSLGLACTLTSCSVKVSNIGTDPSGATDVIFRKGSNCATATEVLATTSVGALSSGTESATLSVTFASLVTNQWVCVEVDDANAVMETDETDNFDADYAQ